MLWTGVAFKLCDQLQGVDLTFKRDVDGEIIPAMPAVLYGDTDEVSSTAEWICVGGQVTEFYDNSIALKYGVSSIPPKVTIDRIYDPVLRERMEKSRDGLDRFHQHSIVDFNIGSNVGLMHMVKYLLSDPVLSGGDYIVLCVDMNIYDRLIKVVAFCSHCLSFSCLTPQFVYDKCGIGRAFGNRVHVSLGLWHNYKQACLLVYRKFANWFFAPLFHELWPVDTFYPKAKIPQITTIFTYMRLSYPTWRPKLDQFLAQIIIPPASLNHAKNLKALMEFFIPTVSSLDYTRFDCTHTIFLPM
jgi:hypothetical protein